MQLIMEMLNEDEEFYFWYKQDLNYADLIDKYSLEDIVYNSGMFAKAFPIEKNLIKIE